MPEKLTLYYTENPKARVASVKVDAVPFTCAGIAFHVHDKIHPVTGKPMPRERNISRNGVPTPWTLLPGEEAKAFVMDYVRGYYTGQCNVVCVERFITDLVAWQRVYRAVTGKDDAFFEKERAHLLATVKRKGNSK